LSLAIGPTPATSAPSPNGSSATPIDELIARDKVSLDLFWLRDESLEDADNLPPPEVLAAEIAEDLEAALAEIQALAESLAASTNPE